MEKPLEYYQEQRKNSRQRSISRRKDSRRLPRMRANQEENNSPKLKWIEGEKHNNPPRGKTLEDYFGGDFQQVNFEGVSAFDGEKVESTFFPNPDDFG